MKRSRQRLRRLERRLRKYPVTDFLWRMTELYFNKRVSRSSAELAYFLILSFFPVLICVNTIIGALRLDVQELLAHTAGIVPDAAVAVLTEYVNYISQNQSSTLLVAGIVMTLFSASAAIRALMEAMGDVYGRQAYTGVWEVVASVVFAVLFLLTIYLSLVVVLTGNWFFHLLESAIQRIPQLSHFRLPWQWQWMRFVLLFLLVMIFVMLTYRAVAPRGKPRPPLLLGAFLASAALVGSSVVFSWFIGMSSRYSLVYGSLASVAILLVWLYLCGNILILGCCFNYLRLVRRREKKK